jgi:hypothetical protein
MINEILNKSKSMATPVCRAGSSRILALSSCLDRLIIGRFSEFLHFVRSQVRIGESANANVDQIGNRYAVF